LFTGHAAKEEEEGGNIYLPDRHRFCHRKCSTPPRHHPTGFVIENAAPRLVITTTSSAIENAEAGSAGELKCRIVVSDRRTHRQLELI
jgi:hypothetical protein